MLHPKIRLASTVLPPGIVSLEDWARMVTTDAQNELHSHLYDLYSSILNAPFGGYDKIPEIKEFANKMRVEKSYSQFNHCYHYVIYGELAQQLYESYLPVFIDFHVKQLYERVKSTQYYEKAYIEYVAGCIPQQKMPLAFEQWKEQD